MTLPWMDSTDIWVGDNWVLQKELIGHSEAPGYCKNLEDLAHQPYYRAVRLEHKSKLWNGEGHANQRDMRIRCSWLDCHCYPFAYVACKSCKKQRWIHCRKGRVPHSVCGPCWREQRDLTDQVLKYKVATRELKEGSPAWWEIYSKGVNPNLYCYHLNEPCVPFATDILRVKCQR